MTAMPGGTSLLIPSLQGTLASQVASGAPNQQQHFYPGSRPQPTGETVAITDQINAWASQNGLEQVTFGQNAQ